MLSQARRLLPALGVGAVGVAGAWHFRDDLDLPWAHRKELQVYHNGGSQALDLPAASLSELSRCIQSSTHFAGLDDGFRLLSKQGPVDKDNFGDLPNGSALYVVPAGLEFRWPAGKLGEKTVVDGMLDAENSQEVTMTLVSTDPAVFIVDNLLNDRDIDEIKAWATDTRNPIPFEPKSVRGSGSDPSNRPSSTVDLHWPGRHRMSDRVFRLLRIEPDIAKYDGHHIIRYRKGQALVDHLDSIGIDRPVGFNPDPANQGTNRHATVFVLLSEVPESAGGMTVFPTAKNFVHPDEPTAARQLAMASSEKLFAKGSWEYHMAQRCFSGEHLAIQPKRGRTILFYHQDGMAGTLDDWAIHGGCPIVKDGFEKWGLTAWVWNGRQHNPDVYPPNT